MMNLYKTVKINLIKQIRSYSFLIVICISLFLGYACVPAASDGYQIFYIGGVRGIYNSAWLGGMAAMLSSLLLWLFGFYFLRSQISEDKRLKVSGIIAATPISKLRYILVKAISNYVVLLVISVLFMAAFMVMQLFRGEDYQLKLWDFIIPFLFITLPSLLVLASLTVFFDVLPGFKNTFGNIVFFLLWVSLSVISIAVPNHLWDLYGFHTILSDMVREAQAHFPNLIHSLEGGSFGYYPANRAIPTYEWQGVDWNIALLTSRAAWVGAAAVILMVTSLLFSRFSENTTKPLTVNLVNIFESKEYSAFISDKTASFYLSPVQSGKGTGFFRCIAAEIRLMIMEMSVWWKFIMAASTACTLLLPVHMLRNFLSFFMLLPIAIWSQMGTRENHYNTKDILASSCSFHIQWLGSWLAGILITFLISTGVLLRFVLDSQPLNAALWAVGSLFIPTLGIAMGSLSRNRKLFEVFYLLWWYMGPFNKIPYLDFLGLTGNYLYVYLGFTFGLFLAAAILHIDFERIRLRIKIEK